MIKVLIVDDSAVQCELLKHIFSADADIQIVGTAANGAEALRSIALHKPDVATMDIEMPVMDGFQATRHIMETDPLPIVIISSHWNAQETAKTMQAMQAGAVATIEKPHGPGHPDYNRQAQHVLRTVKAMAGVRVVKRWNNSKYQPATPIETTGENTSINAQHVSRGSASASRSQAKKRNLELVAIGASTGGPPVLQTILQGLSINFPAPILIVQHMTSGFTDGLREWLVQSTGIPIHLGCQGAELLSGNAYLAPDNYHMGIDASRRLVLNDGPAENGLRPAVSFLFHSVAAFYPTTSAAVLLTGMGRDGAAALSVLRERGATTFAQDQASSLVHGMPGEAIKLGAAEHILPPRKIVEALRALCAM
jgi:two-component system chemotaxis response regulator CheB